MNNAKAFVFAVVAVAAPLALDAQDAALAAKVDRVVASVSPATAAPAPGCSVGVSSAGHVVERAFGMADIELGVPLTPQSILESGSVAKQFTAASVVILALEGKLRLDDPVRKYVPELPDYGVPLTIRHLMNHTSGIRDWGTVLELTGFGRGARVVSQALALDVITRQRGIDFTPGAEYSYSNSGYTLLSTIVERVSGESLPAFTARRFFQPLGMTHSQWRDDFTRLVPGRAQAYAPAATGGWKLDMPFMNVYGNGGLLTTAGDWLKWNAMLESRSMDGALVDSLERQGVLLNGHHIAYALGLEVTTYKGKRQVAHSGSTAGYSTYLTRFPELQLSIAVLCNAANANPTALAMKLVDEIAGPLPVPAAPDTVAVPVAELQKRVALWREQSTHFSARTIVDGGVLRVGGGVRLHSLRDGSFLAAAGPITWQFDLGADGRPLRARRIAPDGEQRFVAETPWTPTAAELAAFAGEWRSDEAGASFTFAVEDGQAVLKQRPARNMKLRPLYQDHFGPLAGDAQVVWFTRDPTGTLTMHIGASRMRDMPFTRTAR
jgi:CubicO group peptidase (beta-lactamase class C family)